MSKSTRISSTEPGSFLFGITDLDDLFKSSVELQQANRKMLWSAAIVGPDGTGKSILAMHIASEYLRAFKSIWNPRVFYLSTDLSENQAKATWNAFGLNSPKLKKKVLKKVYEDFCSREAMEKLAIKKSVSSSETIELLSVSPNAKVDLEKMAGVPSVPRLFFLDLHKETAGDDWNFVNHMLGLIPGTEKVPNLLIVDAVEGLEAFIGDIDTFGQSRTRRSRIAQLSRNCVQSRTNVVFVTERMDESKREPEQFLADYVFALRVRQETDYLKRTIEVEKFRGAWHSRGEHEFSIRDGGGTFSGVEPHLDEPRIPWPRYGRQVKTVRADDASLEVEAENSAVSSAKSSKAQTLKNELTVLSHLLVIPSLHSWNRNLRAEERELNSPDGKPTFGLLAIDRLLGSNDVLGDTPPVAMGIRCKETATIEWSETSFAPIFQPKATPDVSYALRDDAISSDCNFSICSQAEVSSFNSTYISFVRVEVDDNMICQSSISNYGSISDKCASSTDTNAQTSCILETPAKVDLENAQDPTKLKIAGSITFLLGDPGTHKSRLGRRFLAEVALGKKLGKKLQYMPQGVAVMISTSLLDKKGLLEKLAYHLAQDAECEYCEALATLLVQEDNEKCRRILCRRLSVRHLSSSHFLRIIEQQIKWAKMQLRSQLSRDNALFPVNAVISNEEKNGKLTQMKNLRSGAVRIVIDDWNNILETHPNLANDPLLLQSLMAYLKREGVTALLLSTQPGQPFIPTSETAKFDLRKIDEQHIYTWNVSFFGERRTALTCLRDRVGKFEPEVLELQPVLPGSPKLKCRPWRELQTNATFCVDLSASLTEKQREDLVNVSLSPEDECLVTSREFGLYAGVEYGAAERVPLEVRLVSVPHLGKDSSEAHFEYPRLLTQTLGKVFPTDSSRQVVSFESFEDYELFSTYADWLDDSRSGRTLILQIDEFWHARQKSLMDLSQFWQEDCVAVAGGENNGKFVWNHVGQGIDEYGLWKPHIILETDPNMPETDLNFLTDSNSICSITSGYYSDLVKDRRTLRREDMALGDNRTFGSRLDRVPYYWDFGFILADRVLWESCAEDLIEFPSTSDNPITVRQIWNSLCIAGDEIEKRKFRDGASDLSETGASDVQPQNDNQRPPISWTDFLTACEKISLKHPGFDAFDIDARTPESLSCALLELWASFAFKMKPSAQLFTQLHERSSTIEGPTLKQLLTNHSVSLLAAITALTHASSHLAGTPNRNVTRIQPSKGFVASRHWYTTAAMITRESGGRERTYSMLALPGNYTTRGDWYLAVGAGSRSRLVAERAIDLMTSRKMNLVRLHEGFGLPVRDVLPGVEIKQLGTALLRPVRALGIQQSVTLGELVSLGFKQDERNWLWRSRIRHYDRDCIYFRKWISRTLFERRSWFNGAGSVQLGKLLSVIPAESQPILPNVRSDSELIEPHFSTWKGESLGELGKTLGASGLKKFGELLRLVESALRE